MFKFKNTILLLLTIVTMPTNTAQAWFAYSPEWEQVNNNYFYQETINANGLNQDKAAQQDLREQADLVLTTLGENPAEYKVAITQEKGYNAYSTLGKNVFCSSLFKNAFGYHELVSVLGHEFSHVKNEDTLKKLDESVRTKIIGTALFDIFAQGKNYQTQQQMSMGLTVLRNQILKGSLGREQENRADQESWEKVMVPLAEQHRVNPGGQLASFSRLKLIYGSGQGSAIGWLSSLVNPDEHESNAQRWEKSLTRLTEFSKGRLTIKNGADIWVDNQFLVTSSYTEGNPATVNACLEAGRLASMAHDGKLPTDRAALLKIYNKYKEQKNE